MALTRPELLALLQPDGVQIPRPGELTLTGVSSLQEASPQELSFLANPRYQPQLATTRAGAVLLTPDTELPESLTFFPLFVADPSAAFTRVTAHFASQRDPFHPGIDPTASVSPDAHFDPQQVAIGPQAVVEAGAHLGPGTHLGPGVLVGARARIGAHCRLLAGSIVTAECELGDRVVLQPQAIIGSDGFGYHTDSQGRHTFIPQTGKVVLEDDVEIGAHTCVDRARFGETRIGRGTKVDNLVQIAHNVRIGAHCLIISQTGIAGSSEIGDHCVVAAQSGVVGHIKVSPHITLGARTGVTKDLTEPGTYLGAPARPIVEEQKLRAHYGRLTRLQGELKDLRQRLAQLEKNQP